MASRDEEISEVAARLDSILDALRTNVDTLNAILTRPADQGGGEENERLVPQ